MVQLRNTLHFLLTIYMFSCTNVIKVMNGLLTLFIFSHLIQFFS